VTIEKASFMECDFASRIDYELKRAERYRVFLSLAVFNFGPIIDLADIGSFDTEKEKTDFISSIHELIKHSVREVDAVSNSGNVKVGILLPETPRQAAESTINRLSDTIRKFCADYFRNGDSYLFPIEISSFPDATGTKSISSYIESFKNA
jgi:hypothetical protein